MERNDKPVFWRKHIEAQWKSGKSQRLYCMEHGLNIHTFHFWKKKLSSPQSGSKDKPEANKQKSLEERADFIPIHLNRSKPPLIELTLTEDMELFFSFKADINLLKASTDR